VRPEVLVEHVKAPVPVRRVRSTLVQSSVGFLRARGHYDRYLAVLDGRHREAIVGSLAPGWMDVEVVLAHYAACDAMNLPLAERVALGEGVGERVQGPFMKTIIQGARAVGVTPFTLFARFDALWERVFEGGSTEVTKVGPKDVSVEFLHALVPRFEYCRTALAGIFRAGIKLGGGRSAYITPLSYDPQADRFVLRASWV
jgi:hypothetical protein